MTRIVLTISNEMLTQECLPHSVISVAPVFSVVLPVPQETQFPEPAPVLYFPISQGSQDAPPWPALQTESEEESGCTIDIRERKS